MKDDSRGRGAAWKRYAVTAGIGIGLFLLLTFTQGGFVEPDPAIRWRILCDALFIPGVLLVAFGLLLFAAGGGVFDMLKFSVMKALSVIMTKKRREALPKTFFDFRQEREARDRARTGHLLVIGAVFLILAALALVMYSRFEPLI